jgi:antitoxin MazE
LQKYGLTDSLILEEKNNGLFIRNKEEIRLSWKDTYKSMAEENEDWEDFDITLLDGLDDESES